MKIAIVDSGIHPNHPHVGAVAGGVAIVGNDYLDRLGHGTAIAGAIREKAPDAELYAVKVFDRRLSTNLETILRALDWCVQHQMDVINLSLGAPVGQVPDLPSSLVVTIPNLIPNAIEVLPEESCPREIFHYRDEIFYASPYPRPIPNVPPEKNLNGASFAVANMTGFVARALAQTPRDSIRSALIALAANNP